MLTFEEFVKRTKLNLQSKEDEEIIINGIKVKMLYALNGKKVKHFVSVNDCIIYQSKTESKAQDVFHTIPNILKALNEE